MAPSNFSVLDGWWREAFNGQKAGPSGKIKTSMHRKASDHEDAQSIYNLLENEIIPLFYERDPKEIPHEWIARMKDLMKTAIRNSARGAWSRNMWNGFMFPPEMTMFNFLFSPSAWLIMLMIFCLRVTDMSLDTLRLLFVVRGAQRHRMDARFLRGLPFISSPLRAVYFGQPIDDPGLRGGICNRQCGRHVDRRAPRHRTHSDEHYQFAGAVWRWRKLCVRPVLPSPRSRRAGRTAWRRC